MCKDTYYYILLVIVLSMFSFLNASAVGKSNMVMKTFFWVSIVFIITLLCRLTGACNGMWSEWVFRIGLWILLLAFIHQVHQVWSVPIPAQAFAESSKTSGSDMNGA